jgi:hypothetical protein
MTPEQPDQPAIDVPIHSIALHATAKYLSTLGDTEPEKLTEGDQLLQQLFFQHSLLLTAVNSSITLSKQVTEAMQAHLAKLRGEEPEAAPLVEQANNIIVPDRF